MLSNLNLDIKKSLVEFSVRINLPLFSTILPSSIFMFLSCRPFVVITTTGQKHKYTRWDDGGK